MRIEVAEARAAEIERHACMHVELIANAVGMLREMGASIPAFTVPACSWLVLARHEGERGPTLLGYREDDALMVAVSHAMAQHGMHQMTPDDAVGETEIEADDWRCPIHEAAFELAQAKVSA